MTMTRWLLTFVLGGWFCSADVICLAQQGGAERAAEPLPRIGPKEPDDALKTFQTLDGFQMQLLACEPLVVDPVAMAYDEDGRAYVAEMIDYPHVDKAADVPFTDQSGQKPIGRVRLLEDTDGDGRFDRSTIFADKLSWPTGVAVWQGGVFVGATPDIWFLKDTDGDGRAEVRQRLYTGFRKFNVQAVMNNLIWGLDHMVYGSAAGNGGTVRSLGRPSARPVVVTRRDFRFNPVTGLFQAISGSGRFGNTFNDWGDRFICNIRNPAQHVVLPQRYLSRNRYLPVRRVIHDAAPSGDQLPVYPTSGPEPWRLLRARRWAEATDRVYPRSETIAAGFVTSTSGVTIYRGSAWPARYYGNLFVGEVAGNLIHRQRLTPDGVTFKAARADQGTEFVTSTDNWFRPVNFVNAPDGTLHVLDMYREIIEHPWSIPDDMRARMDLRSGCDRGRVYRLAPAGFRVPPPPRLSRATTEQLVRELENGSCWWRQTAHRLIYERQDRSAVPLLRRLLAGSPMPQARLLALWSLEGLGQLSEMDLLTALSDGCPQVRRHAVRLAEVRFADSPALWSRVVAMAEDPDVRVRFQVAFSVGEVPGGTGATEAALTALATIGHRDAADPWVRTAILSSTAQTAERLLAKLLTEGAVPSGRGGIELVKELATVTGVRNRADQVRSVLEAAAGAGVPVAVRCALVAGLGNGLGRAGAGLPPYMAGDSDGARMLRSVLARARRIAEDEGAPLVARVEAIDLLRHQQFDQVRPVLAHLLLARQPPSLQTAAARCAGRFRQPAVADLLLSPWPAYTPGVRAEVLDVLLARSTWVSRLLDAVEAGRVRPVQITAPAKSRLLRQRDPTVRQRAVRLIGAASSSRKDVIDRYRRALTLAGDPERGRTVFEKHCMTCHRLEGRGYDIGPSLASVKHRTAEEILIHIFDPNRVVSPEYVSYAVALDDGRVLTGIIAAETATSITLRRAENATDTILRDNIEQIASTGQSIMPEGLEEELSVQDTAHLLSYLLRAP